MRGDAFLSLCGILCVWPLLIGALPTFLLMKYGSRLRSPIRPVEEIRVADRQVKPTSAAAAAKARAADEKIGYGARQ